MNQYNLVIFKKWHDDNKWYISNLTFSLAYMTEISVVIRQWT